MKVACLDMTQIIEAYSLSRRESDHFHGYTLQVCAPAYSVKMVIHRGNAGQRIWVITGTEVLDINDTTAAWFQTGRCYNSTETGAECNIMQGDAVNQFKHKLTCRQ